MNRENLVHAFCAIVLATVWVHIILGIMLLLSSCVTWHLDPPRFTYLACVTITDGDHKGMVGRIVARLPPDKYRVVNDTEVAEVYEVYIAPYVTVGDVCEREQK